MRFSCSSPTLKGYYSDELTDLDDAHKAVGVLTIKNGKRIIGMHDLLLRTLTNPNGRLNIML